MLQYKAYSNKERAYLDDLYNNCGEPSKQHDPKQVAQILVDWHAGVEVISAALLFNSKAAKEALSQIIINDFAKLVELDKQLNDQPTFKQSFNNMKNLFLATVNEPQSLLVWLANRVWLINSKQVTQRDARLALGVYAPLAEEITVGIAKVQLEEPAFRFLQPEQYQKLSRDIEKITKQRAASFDESVEYLTQCLKEAHVSVLEFDKRRKNVYSAAKKLVKVGVIEEMYDLLAVRIIVPRITDCYKALSVLHEHTEPMMHRIKDYIALPKPNGYQSLHTTIKLPNDVVIEVQIRTPDMHRVAETGLAAHYHYSQHKDTKSYRRGTGAKAILDQPKKRVYVFSPKGDVYDLPKSATALDFAFAVHTLIGLSTKAIKNNGRIVKLDSGLRNGDTLEVITRKLPRPHQDWLKTLKTAKAKNKVRSWFQLHN